MLSLFVPGDPGIPISYSIAKFKKTIFTSLWMEGLGSEGPKWVR